MTREAGDSSPVARLARLGFTDTGAIAQAVADNALLEGQLDKFRHAANPDLALLTVARILNTGAVDAGAWSADMWERIALLCGASVALGEHLLRQPSHCTYVLESQTVPSAHQMHAELREAIAGLEWAPALDALRIAYRRQVCAIAAIDLRAGSESAAMLPGIAGALSDLADAVVAAALECARVHVPGGESVRLAVIAMGKCGARELNYVSDVDVMFVANDASETAISIAKLVMQACSTATAQGTIWEIDAALRPEGKAGPLVRTDQSYLDYYSRWAKDWEFQALLKARFMAGDEDLANELLSEVSPMVWQAASRTGFVESVQAMRERVADLIPTRDADRELKLGRGGLRDVEFAVQLLQLVHGRSDPALRSPNTLAALEQLATWGYVGREDAAALAQAYSFLRTLEHRIQVSRMRRTHIVPTEPEALHALGRSLGLLTDSSDELTKLWRQHAREVRRIHEKLFYRPLLDAVARLSAGDARLTPEAAGARLSALGFADPDGALRHLDALTSGVSRKAAIQRTLLPVMLDWFAQCPNPDAGLLGFRNISAALGETPWYLRLLRDESVTAQRLAVILASSRYASDLLLRAPEAVSMLADEALLVPRTAQELSDEVDATVSRHTDTTDCVAVLRAMRRRELFRIAAAQVLDVIDVEVAGAAISDVTDAVIGGAVRAVARGNTVPFAVIAMGRYGGSELGFGSDADIMFVYDDRGGVGPEAAQAIASELRSVLMAPSTDPELILDADLRPEGRNGPLVRSLSSYAQYYQRWSAGWESQALLRARPCVGDADLGAAFIDLVAPLRYSSEGLTTAALTEIRRLKARMESERLPRGVDPLTHVKLGPGGLSDVEWVVQVLQMQHAGMYESLRTTRTLEALRSARDLGLIQDADEQLLERAWVLASRVRNASMLARGKASDSLPTDVVELAKLGQTLGYGPRSGQALREDYLRSARQARQVFMRLFYGIEDDNSTL